jgi:hypothetical protein
LIEWLAQFRRTNRLDLALWVAALLGAVSLVPSFRPPWWHVLALVVVVLFLPAPRVDASARQRLPWQGVLIAATLGYFHWFSGVPWSAVVWVMVWLPVIVLVRAPWSRLLNPAQRAELAAGSGVWPAVIRLGQFYQGKRGDIVLAEAVLIGAGLHLSAVFCPTAFPAFPQTFLGLPLWVALRMWHANASCSTSLAIDCRRLILALLVWSALGLGCLMINGHSLGRPQVAFLALAAAALLAQRLLLRAHESNDVRGDAGESYRWILLLLASLWLLKGFATPILQGASDALWYGTMVADAVAQIRTGIFPLVAGQSAYQFNGAIYPLRVAPAFQHGAALLDLLTLRTLGVFALQNLLITFVGCATIFASYFCLSSLSGGRRCLATALALLFLSCPGVLGLAYNNDLYMSWMTLPWLCLALWAASRSFQDNSCVPRLTLGAALGILWWGHAPIALWSTIIAAIVQIVRLSSARPLLAEVKRLLLPGALFALIAGYPIGSVLLYPPEAGVNAAGFQVAHADNIFYLNRSAFPGSVLPLSEYGRALGDFQLGYALAAVLLWMIWRNWRNSTAAIRTLLCCSCVFLLLLLPVPGLNEGLWKLVPVFVRNTTGNWVMNRLYLILAGSLVTAAALTAARGPFRSADTGRRWLLGSLLVLACGWSMVEARKFADGSLAHPRPATSAVDLLRPENVRLTSFAYLVFPHPPANFSHGVVDPQLEHRLLAPDGATVLAGNYAQALQSGQRVETLQLVRSVSGGTIIFDADKSLTLLPGRHYLAQFAFALPTDFAGVLQIQGQTLFREYILPSSGEPRSFGAGGSHSNLLSLWTTSAQPETVHLRLVVTGPAPADNLLSAAQVQLWEYPTDSLMAQVLSWLPYRLTVRAPVPGLLETPRMFQVGYVATVNGAATPVRKTANGLVAIPVPSGNSVVGLQWHAPVGLLMLFWISALSMLAWLIWSVRQLWSRPAAQSVIKSSP